MLAVAGTFSYLKLGRAEDPNFTIQGRSRHHDLARRHGAGNAGSGCGPDRKEAAGNGYVSQERVNQAAKDSSDRELSFASHDAASPVMKPAARSGQHRQDDRTQDIAGSHDCTLRWRMSSLLIPTNAQIMNKSAT
jgi:hypothetical protein